MSQELDNIDTNISNYTDEELLNISGLDSNASKNAIKKRLDTIINNYSINNNNPKLANFFRNAKNKLLSFSGSQQDTSWKNSTNHAEYLLHNQYITPDITKNIINRGEATQTVDSTTTPVTIKQQLDVNNTIPLSIAQDTLNPTLRQVTSRIITIDSQFRPNTIPFSSNPLSTTSSTNFTCSLNERLKNVLQLSLISLHVPKKWYTFDYYLQNTQFSIKNCSTKQIFPFQIPDGDYNETSLLNEIKNTMIKDPSYEDISSISLEFISSNTINKNLKFINNSSTISYEIMFSSSDNNFEGCIKNENRFNLGYYLGFRTNKENYENTKLTNSFFLDISANKKPRTDINKNKLKDSAGKNIYTNEYVAETSINVQGSQYFILSVDDFNYNHPNTGGINITTDIDKLPLPSYISKVSQDISSSRICVNEQKNITQYVPTFPRKLTQAQLYSVNEIINNRKKINNNINNTQSSSVLAIIPISSNIDNISGSLLLDLKNSILHERKFFGPVSIERFKISLRDDKNNIVNLHGHDWSFTMRTEELYQY